MFIYTYFLNLNLIVPFWTWSFLILLMGLLFYVFFRVARLRENKIREIEATKIELEKLRSENYKTRLEREQINNFFSTSLLLKNDVDEILWDVTKNLIAKLDFEDCLIYMWNEDKTKMVQRAGFGLKDSKEILIQFPYDVAPGEGIVGTVAQKGHALIVPDTRKDPRYLAEGYSGLSEIAVPIKYEDELLGVIDSEHSELGFFNENHLQMITTIGTLMASKIKSIEADQQLRKQKAELDNISKQLTEMQLAALRSQMNPHFIFNALNSIKKFVLSNDAENADIYLGKFSKLIRSILNTTREANISLGKEIEMLTLYLELEKLRFGKKLNYHIYVDPSLEEGSIFIPTMIVQPFIENAMLHGIMHKDCCDGEILVSFLDHEDHLEINVKDNGVGRKAAADISLNKNDFHTSLGIEVTARRLEALKTNSEIPSGIEIVDLEEKGNPAGTLVKIFVPQ
ncbi:MAG: histidine kinase [Bacteroidota bacterium]|nr:histidine kinase [Bacteroidota bacterium]